MWVAASGPTSPRCSVESSWLGIRFLVQFLKHMRRVAFPCRASRMTFLASFAKQCRRSKAPAAIAPNKRNHTWRSVNLLRRTLTRQKRGAIIASKSGNAALAFGLSSPALWAAQLERLNGCPRLRREPRRAQLGGHPRRGVCHGRKSEPKNCGRNVSQSKRIMDRRARKTIATRAMIP